MAGRWRSTQRRKRWTDHAAPLPEGALAALQARPSLQPFALQLAAFERQPTTYAQLALVKKLGGALLAALRGGDDDEAGAACLGVYAELFFAENSRPLHRGLLSSLADVPARHGAALRRAFRARCRNYGAGGAKESPFAVVAVSASLASLPHAGPMREVARDCAPLLSNSLCRDVRRVVQHALDGGRPTPAAMEDCQDALSSIYYFLQQFPDEFRPRLSPTSMSNEEQGTDFSECGKFSHSPSIEESPDIENDFEGRNSERDEERFISKSLEDVQFSGSEEERDNTDTRLDVYETTACTLLDVLQTAVLSRDCLVAAGVGLAAAAQLSATTEGLAVLLANALFDSSTYTYAVLSLDGGVGDANGARGVLEAIVASQRGSSLGKELDKLSKFGRLCFFRGLLTAVSRNTQNVHLIRKSRIEERQQHKQGVAGQEELHWQAWTVLYDGILPALCGFCERSVDSHFKFHAATAMQICLQQIKTSICGDQTPSSFKDFQRAVARHGVSVSPYDPLPPGRIKQILQLIWNNWEDPLTQTVKQVQVVFDLLIDVQLVHNSDTYMDNSAEEENGDSPQSTKGKMDEMGTQNFLQQVAADLLAAGRYRKGKYVPLASLVRRIGAQKMLQMSPNLVFQTIDAFSDDDVCSSASTFLKIFLERLKEDCWSVYGIMEGTVVARRSWVPPLLSGLVTGDARLRNNLTTYALPVAMNIDNDSLPLVLVYILDVRSNSDGTLESNFSWEELEGARGLPGHLTVNQRVVLLISVLKVARSLALIEGSVDLNPNETAEGTGLCNDESLGLSHAVLTLRGQAIKFPVRLLLLALTHKEDGVRVDAAEFICLNPKTASMPSPLELSLLRIALRLNMRCSSTAFRMRWTSFLKKFFLRVRTAVERQCKANIVKSQSQMSKASTSLKGSGSVDDVHDNVPGSTADQGVDSAVTVELMQEFMQWLGQTLVSSLYPSAPYERKSMAMEVFHALLEVWSLEESWQKRSGRYTSSPYLDIVEFSPYHRSLLSVDFTLVVVGAIVDSWDRLREGAYRLLVRYPTPLPGLESESSVEGLLRWAKSLVNSPRVRECDAGALAFRLIFRKYVVGLGWSFVIHPEPKVLKTLEEGPDSKPDGRVGEVVVKFLASLCDWLQWGIEEGEKDLLKACAHSFVHGVLLVLRYTVEETEWTSAGVQLSSANLHVTLARLLSLLLRVTSLALWVVSADALNLQEKLGVHSPHGSTVSENSSTRSAFVAANYGSVEDEYESDNEESLAPPEQMVMVGCWLSVKEVSLLLGTIASVVPLPGGSLSGSNIGRGEKGTVQGMLPPVASNSTSILDSKQLEAIGAHFVQVLLSMKHNGAIDKARIGFTALCDRLLRSNNARLNKLPEVWLREVMDHTAARGQVVDDLLRRSAGIPPAFLALFHAEPDGSPKKLLPSAMRWLINTCKKFVGEWSCQIQEGMDGSNRRDDFAMTGEAIWPLHTKPEDGLGHLKETGAPVAFKSRHEGVVPTVHSFNALRMIFHDTNLATDTSGFCAEGLMTAIKAFASSHWEVRNSATLAFTALVHRTIGFLNVFKRESARRAITGFEFFHRYPALHPFLLRELQSATWQLEHGAYRNEGKGLASLLHPSLASVLIILSRLKPSFISSDVEDWLNPSAFMPYVSKCATQKNLHIRVLASRALAPLVPPEHLFEVVVQLAQSLPLSSPRHGVASMTTQEKLSPDRAYGFRDGSQSTGGQQVSTFNAIHGVLLQLCTLLTSNCTSLPDSDLRSRILAQVFLAVEERLWLGSRKLCGCDVVTGSFLELLSCLLSLGNLCQENAPNSWTLANRLQDLLSSLSYECLDDSCCDIRYGDSSSMGLREKAAKIYFGTMLTRGPLASSYQSSGLRFGLSDNKNAGTGSRPSADIDGRLWPPFVSRNLSCHDMSERNRPFALRLRQALTDSSYEVRLATLKVLKKYYGVLHSRRAQTYETPFHEIDLHSEDFIFLRPLIVGRLTVETHPFCTYRILQVIYAWTVIDKEDRGTLFPVGEGQALHGTDPSSLWGSGLSAQELWCCLLNIYHTSKQMKTKEVAIRCLGGCLQQIRPVSADFIMSCDSVSSSTSRTPNRSCHNEMENGVSECDLPSNLAPSVSKEKSVFSVKEVFDIWLGISNAHSLPSKPVNFRFATAEAIIVSGILEDAKWIGPKLPGKVLQEDCQDGETCSPLGATDLDWYAKCTLSAWCICIKLLEDEDVDLRQKLAIAILNEIAKSNLQAELPVPLQVEKVIQLSFHFLSTQFGGWRDYYNVLAGWVLGSEEDDDVISGDVDLVRRLFDKEIDNHHEEELLLVQLCCLQLKKLQRLPRMQGISSDGMDDDCIWRTSKENGDVQQISASGDEKISKALSISPWRDKFEVQKSRPLSHLEVLPNSLSAVSWYDQFSRTWRAKCLKRAVFCARASVKLKDSVQWVGGVTNHQDTFKRLYRSLLGLQFVIPPIRETPPDQETSLDDKEFVQGLAEVSVLLQQLPLNPLVSNALIQVLQAYEHQLQVRLGSLEIRTQLGPAFCEAFSPLFLVS